MPTMDELRMLQALPLSLKIRMTKRRVLDWVKEFGEDGVCLSWSGGKDSTVLRHMIREEFPGVVSVFVNTGLEYPEIQRFVKAAKDRGEPVEILRPAMRFDGVIKTFGYPLISKRVADYVYSARRNPDSQRAKWIRGDDRTKFVAAGKYEPLVGVDFRLSARCCDVMKKAPLKKYQKETGRVPITATMACESLSRTEQWIKTGCNGFNMKSPISNPMSFWTEQDVLEYIKTYDVEIASVYGEVVYNNDPEQIRLEELTDENIGCDRLCTTGCARTGCIFCGLGAHLQKGESRFERLKRTHPRQYNYCIGGGEYNEDGIWQPNKDGLGLGHVFDELNRIYGGGFIRY